jgi:hypothetical protein
VPVRLSDALENLYASYLRPANKALPLATIVVGLTKRPDQLVVTLQSDVQFLEV